MSLLRHDMAATTGHGSWFTAAIMVCRRASASALITITTPVTTPDNSLDLACSSCWCFCSNQLTSSHGSSVLDVMPDVRHAEHMLGFPHPSAFERRLSRPASQVRSFRIFSIAAAAQFTCMT